MTRRAKAIDAQLRRLPLPSDEQAAAMSSQAAKQALFEKITAMPVTTGTRPAPAAPKQRRISRRTLVIVTILASLSVAAVGGAAITRLAQDSTAVACHTNDGSVSVMDSVTGDPVVDCRATWRRLGLEPPALAAYDNGRGGIEVLPADAPPKNGWEPLGSGVVQDPRLLELDAALNDHGDGLPSECYELAAARAIAEREVERLGLEGWTTRAERGEADGITACTYSYLDPGKREVVLLPMDGITPSGPFAGYARGLAEVLDQECLSVPQAAQAARHLAAEAGVADMGLVIHEVVDETFDCARSEVNVGGRVEAIIRGPAATS